MAITFACGGCAKRYDVDESMAGRRARCKQCGSEFRVPDLVPSKSSPREDVFGLDAPAPAAIPPRAMGGSRSEFGESAAPRRIRAKSSRKKGSGGSDVARIVVLTAGIAAFAVGLVFVGHALVGANAAPQTEFERLVQDQIGIQTEMVAIFKGVTDVESARANAGRFSAVLPRFQSSYARFQALPKPTGWEDTRLGLKYNTQLLALNAELSAEKERVQQIPGALEALRGHFAGPGGMPFAGAPPAFRSPQLAPPGAPQFAPPGAPRPPQFGPGNMPGPNLQPPSMPRPPGFSGPRFGPGRH